MNIINLRNVGSTEIPDSYRGILRISPNGLEDDATKLLLDPTQTIHLSDSGGNQLPLSFTPKIYSVSLVDRVGLTDLIELSINIDNLFISKELNVKNTLYIDSNKKHTPPIIFSDGSNAVGYPFESPYDAVQPQYYILGARAVDKYNKSKALNDCHNIEDLDQNSGTYTQLSFLPLEMFSAAWLTTKVRR